MKDQKRFRMYLSQAVDAIERRNFQEGKALVMQAIVLDVDAPEPHNLLGILAEHEADRILAAKHYRAASALDPTYMPAQNNLSRVTSSNGFITRPKDFGKTVLPEKKCYEVEFDTRHIGHVKKRAN